MNDVDIKIKDCLNRFKKDPVFAFSKVINIVNKQGKEVNLKPNRTQIKYLKNKGRLNFVIKARRMGFTTIEQASCVLSTRLNKNWHGLILNKDKTDNPDMFSKIKYMCDKLPTLMQGDRERDTGTSVRWEDTRSSLTIDTAGQSILQASRKGRGSNDLNFLHGTECGYWAPGTLSSIIQGAGNTMTPDGVMTFESTSSGAHNEFSRFCMEIYQKGELTDDNCWRIGDKVLHFFSWLDQDEYRLPIDNNFNENYDEEELRLIGLGADNEQLAWRRWKMNQNSDIEGVGRYTKEQKFRLEYPATFMDSMEAGGGLYFDLKVLEPLKSYYKATEAPPVQIGLMFNEHKKPVICAPTTINSFDIWQPPADNWTNRYILFVDVATGTDTSDFDVGYVLDMVSGYVVASYYGRLGADVSCQKAILLANYYNNALIGWDATGVGQGFTANIMASGYKNLFTTCNVDKKQLDVTDYGIMWTSSTKMFSLESLRADIYSQSIKIFCEKFYKETEIFAFQKESSKSPSAPDGLHDDHIMSMAGVSYMKRFCGLVPMKKQNIEAFEQVRRLTLGNKNRDRKTVTAW